MNRRKPLIHPPSLPALPSHASHQRVAGDHSDSLFSTVIYFHRKVTLRSKREKRKHQFVPAQVQIMAHWPSHESRCGLKCALLPAHQAPHCVPTPDTQAMQHRDSWPLKPCRRTARPQRLLGRQPAGASITATAPTQGLRGGAMECGGAGMLLPRPRRSRVRWCRRAGR
jgi:hypothetical protein